MLNHITLSDGEVLDVSVWPLPEGVEDAVLNRTQLARAFKVAENTISSWMADGMPVLSAGKNGVAYEFQLSHCYAWKRRDEEKEGLKKLQAERSANQFSLYWRNLDADQEKEEAGMTADEMRKWSLAEYDRNRLAEQRGDLVRADRVRAVMEDIMVSMSSALESFPDYLEMNFSLSPEQVQKSMLKMDEVRLDMRNKLTELLARSGTVLRMPDRQAEMDL